MIIKSLLLTLFIGAALCQSYKDVFTKLHQSHNWTEGVNTNLCFNMDYLFRLQHTIDYTDVDKIVEIGFGDWSLTNQLYLGGKQYVGYELVQNLQKQNIASNIQFKLTNNIKDIAQSGDLLIIKDVLMYLPNQQIQFIIKIILPRFKYGLIQISATDIPHNDTIVGIFRPLKLQLQKSRLVLEMNYTYFKKQVWLINNS